jgi:hypothetical protein
MVHEIIGGNRADSFRGDLDGVTGEIALIFTEVIK